MYRVLGTVFKFILPFVILFFMFGFLLYLFMNQFKITNTFFSFLTCFCKVLCIIFPTLLELTTYKRTHTRLLTDMLVCD